jgi:hypothetical protein
LREDLDLRSDHYFIETSFFFSFLALPHTPKPLWKDANKVALALRARKPDLLPRNYAYCNDIVAGVARLVRWIEDAVAQHVFFIKACLFFSFLVVY